MKMLLFNNNIKLVLREWNFEWIGASFLCKAHGQSCRSRRKKVPPSRQSWRSLKGGGWFPGKDWTSCKRLKWRGQSCDAECQEHKAASSFVGDNSVGRVTVDVKSCGAIGHKHLVSLWVSPKRNSCTHAQHPSTLSSTLRWEFYSWDKLSVFSIRGWKPQQLALEWKLN